MPRRVLYVSAWVATTAAATVVGLGAVGFVRAASGDVVAQSLSQQEVGAQLARIDGTPSAGTSTAASGGPSQPSSPSSPSPSASRSTASTPPSTRPTASRSASPSHRPSTSSRPVASGTARPTTTTVRAGFTSEGGSVVAQCTGSSVYLVSWSPSTGYRVGEVERGPASDVEARFEAEGHEVKIKVRCSGGRPVATIESGDHD